MTALTFTFAGAEFAHLSDVRLECQKSRGFDFESWTLSSLS